MFKNKEKTFPYDAENILMKINSSFLDESYVLENHWNVEFIHVFPYSESFEYNQKQEELHEKGHSTAETVGFLMLSPQQRHHAGPPILTTDYMIKHKECSWSPTENLGKFHEGVAVFKSADVLLKSAHMSHLRAPKLVMYKIMPGRSKINLCGVDDIEQNTGGLDPNYDACEVDLDSNVGLRHLALEYQLQFSEIYMYDLQLVVQRNRQLLLPRHSPRQVCPVATIHLRAVLTYCLPRPVYNPRRASKRRLLPIGSIAIKACEVPLQPGNKKRKILPKSQELSSSQQYYVQQTYSPPEQVTSSQIPANMIHNYPNQCYVANPTYNDFVPFPTHYPDIIDNQPTSTVHLEKQKNDDDLLGQAVLAAGLMPDSTNPCLPTSESANRVQTSDSTHFANYNELSDGNFDPLNVTDYFNSAAADEVKEKFPDKHEEPSTSNTNASSVAQENIDNLLSSIENQSLLSLCKDAGLKLDQVNQDESDLPDACKSSSESEPVQSEIPEVATDTIETASSNNKTDSSPVHAFEQIGDINCTDSNIFDVLYKLLITPSDNQDTPKKNYEKPANKSSLQTPPMPTIINTPTVTASVSPSKNNKPSKQHSKKPRSLKDELERLAKDKLVLSGNKKSNYSVGIDASFMHFSDKHRSNDENSSDFYDSTTSSPTSTVSSTTYDTSESEDGNVNSSQVNVLRQSLIDMSISVCPDEAITQPIQHEDSWFNHIPAVSPTRSAEELQANPTKVDDSSAQTETKETVLSFVGGTSLFKLIAQSRRRRITKLPKVTQFRRKAVVCNAEPLSNISTLDGLESISSSLEVKGGLHFAHCSKTLPTLSPKNRRKNARKQMGRRSVTSRRNQDKVRSVSSKKPALLQCPVILTEINDIDALCAVQAINNDYEQLEIENGSFKESDNCDDESCKIVKPVSKADRSPSTNTSPAIIQGAVPQPEVTSLSRSPCHPDEDRAPPNVESVFHERKSTSTPSHCSSVASVSLTASQPTSPIVVKRRKMFHGRPLIVSKRIPPAKILSSPACSSMSDPRSQEIIRFDVELGSLLGKVWATELKGLQALSFSDEKQSDDDETDCCSANGQVLVIDTDHEASIEKVKNVNDENVQAVEDCTSIHSGVQDSLGKSDYVDVEEEIVEEKTEDQDSSEHGQDDNGKDVPQLGQCKNPVSQLRIKLLLFKDDNPGMQSGSESDAKASADESAHSCVDDIPFGTSPRDFFRDDSSEEDAKYCDLERQEKEGRCDFQNSLHEEESNHKEDDLSGEECNKNASKNSPVCDDYNERRLVSRSNNSSGCSDHSEECKNADDSVVLQSEIHNKSDMLAYLNACQTPSAVSSIIDEADILKSCGDKTCGFERFREDSGDADVEFVNATSCPPDSLPGLNCDIANVKNEFTKDEMDWFLNDTRSSSRTASYSAFSHDYSDYEDEITFVDYKPGCKIIDEVVKEEIDPLDRKCHMTQNTFQSRRDYEGNSRSRDGFHDNYVGDVHERSRDWAFRDGANSRSRWWPGHRSCDRGRDDFEGHQTNPHNISTKHLN